MSTEPSGPQGGPYDEMLAAWVAAARQSGQAPGKIALIKKLRDATGLRLKDAKDAVERYAARFDVPELRAGGAGCTTSAALIVILLAFGLTSAWLAR